ncbi:helix-turn-helix domain-containing protein [Halalkalicoccus jeotgali]|uniref:Helix-turn-helix type 11 domain-containing protein n=1 Tax=Halalkalicoccus jeotgali (strain DSM 18796 / CECT 7217 / JCM 14584 / KCTC 4019 / B3) TaxID=795797 RepID=L9V5V7_HALJB|nr:hypothetical protein [Halalkalicoccus jeotgali]ELY32580.1 hypothetical protein C497_19414 [Halalkalicoccus jeotgali B3]
MERERAENGRYAEQVTEERVLGVLGRGDGVTRPQSAKQVADKIGCTRQAVDRKLRELEKDGKVLKHELGSRSVAWTPRRMLRRG